MMGWFIETKAEHFMGNTREVSRIEDKRGMPSNLFDWLIKRGQGIAGNATLHDTFMPEMLRRKASKFETSLIP